MSLPLTKRKNDITHLRLYRRDKPLTPEERKKNFLEKKKQLEDDSDWGVYHEDGLAIFSDERYHGVSGLSYREEVTGDWRYFESVLITDMKEILKIYIQTASDYSWALHKATLNDCTNSEWFQIVSGKLASLMGRISELDY